MNSSVRQLIKARWHPLHLQWTNLLYFQFYNYKYCCLALLW